MASDQVVGIPGAKGRPWHARELWASLGALAVVAIAGIAAVTKEAKAEKPDCGLVALYIAGLCAGVVVAVLKVMQSRYKDDKDDKNESPEDIRGCLHVILSTIAGRRHVPLPPDGWMRITVHKVHSTELEQVVDYVGSADGGIGRRFPRNAGLIGAVANDVAKRPLVFERPESLPDDLWIEYLVRKMSLPRQVALRARKDRRSFMGVAIPGPRGDVAAIVYLDAGIPGFFDATTQAIVIYGCIGLAHWINERYYS